MICQDRLGTKQSELRSRVRFPPVHRSSVREFLASEAMHHLGIATTRALSLVASRVEKSRRPWYSNKTTEFSDRAAEMGLTKSAANANARKQQQQQKVAPAPPDIVQMEACAITTRVSPSFLRVGHFELYARRARGDRGAQQSNVFLHCIVMFG
jgi:uncharacterized protein YdiU (UPF0061 family)